MVKQTKATIACRVTGIDRCLIKKIENTRNNSTFHMFLKLACITIMCDQYINYEHKYFDDYLPSSSLVTSLGQMQPLYLSLFPNALNNTIKISVTNTVNQRGIVELQIIVIYKKHNLS